MEKPAFSDQNIMKIPHDVSDILRTMSVMARRLEEAGLPHDATLNDVGEFVGSIVAELCRRRESRDGELVERLVAMSLKYRFAFSTRSVDIILDSFEEWLQNWQRFEAVFRRIGRTDLIDHITDEGNK